MTRTLLSSDKQEIVIGFDSHLCDRREDQPDWAVLAEMAADDYSRVIADAIAQVEPGQQC